MKRPLVLLLAFALTATLVGVAPAAAQDDCSAIGAAASTGIDADQTVVQVAINNNVQAGIVAINFGPGDATTVVESYQSVDVGNVQDVC